MATRSFLIKKLGANILFVITQSTVAAFLLVACIRPAHKDLSAQSLDDQEESRATFTLKEATATMAANEMDPNYRVGLSQKLTLNVCIQDKRTLDAVIGHSFRIEGGGHQQDLKTNISGCLVWTEVIKYNPFATETFVSQERKIIATGVHSGKRTMRFAYDPWGSTGNSFADLNFQPDWLSKRDLVPVDKADDALAGISAKGELLKLPVWPDAFSIQSLDVDASNTNRKLKLHGEFIPNVYQTSTSLANKPRALTDGLFQYHMFFVVETKPGSTDPKINQKFIIFEVHSKKAVKMDNLKLKFDETVELANLINRGELRLAIQIIPVDGPDSLAPYHGVYTLGESGSLTGTFSPKLIDGLNNVTQSFDITTYLDGAYRQDGYKIKTGESAMSLVQTNFAEIQKLNLIPTNSMRVPESDSGFNVTANMAVASNEQQTTNVNIAFKACIQNATGQPVIGQTFKIQRFLGEEPIFITTSTASGGCLNWTEVFKNISYYAKEVPKQGIVTISGNGSEMKIPVAIDPLGTPAYYDLRIASKKQEFENLQTSLKDRKLKLVLKQFSLIPRGDPLFAIDRSLDLDTSQTFNFDLTDAVVERTDRAGGKQNENLRDGYYLLRVAIQKDYIDRVDTENCQNVHVLKDGTKDGCEKVHVATSQKVVHFVNGNIQGTILNLFFSDWRFLRVINNLLVELYPIDYSKLSPQNLNEQMQNLNLEFSDASKSQEAIAKFDSLIDKNSGIYTETNFVGQVIPIEQVIYDQHLYVNDDSRKLLLCQLKQCGFGFQSGVEYDSTDADPEVAKFRLGNLHLIGVKIEDLMGVESTLISNINNRGSKTFDIGQFAKSNFSDLVMLKTSSLETAVPASVNSFLTPPQKDQPNGEEFIARLNQFTPDYHRWFFNCNRQNISNDAICAADSMNNTGFSDRSLIATAPSLLILQDRLPGYDNYLPKASIESLQKFISYKREAAPKTSEEADTAMRRSHLTDNEQRNFAFRLCYFWFNDYIPGQNKSFRSLYQSSNWITRNNNWIKAKYDKYVPESMKNSNQSDLSQDLVDACMVDIFKDPNSVFSFEKKVKAIDFKQSEDTQSLDTFSIDISSSESVSAGITNSKTSSSSTSFNPVAFLGLAQKFAKFFTFLSPISFSWTWTDSRTEAIGSSNGNTTSSGVNLVVEQENMRFDLLTYDSCVNIRLTPAFIESAHLIDRVGPPLMNLNTSLKNEKIKLLTRGILICNGEKQNGPILYTEKYYFIHQTLNDPSVSRRYDFSNNPYSFKLRGENELQTFYALTSATEDSRDRNKFKQGKNLEIGIEKRLQNITGKNQSIPYRQSSYPGVLSID